MFPSAIKFPTSALARSSRQLGHCFFNGTLTYTHISSISKSHINVPETTISAPSHQATPWMAIPLLSSDPLSALRGSLGPIKPYLDRANQFAVSHFAYFVYFAVNILKTNRNKQPTPKKLDHPPIHPHQHHPQPIVVTRLPHTNAQKIPIFQVEPTETNHQGNLWHPSPRTQPTMPPCSGHQTQNHQKMPEIKLDQSISECINSSPRLREIKPI